MNILMILESSFPPDERVENEISQLTSNGHKITLVCFNNIRLYQVEKLDKLTIIRLPISKTIYKFSALALLLPVYFNFWKYHLKKILKANTFNAIHLHDLPLVKIAINISKEMKIPLIADYHENRPEIMKLYQHTNTFFGKILISKTKWLKYQDQFTSKVQKLILVTNEAKDYYVNNYRMNPEKIVVLPNYIDWDRLKKFKIDSNLHQELKDKFTLVYFGDTGLRRGTLTILEAAEALYSHKDIFFLIIGISKEQLLLESIIKRRELNNVKLTGWINVNEAFNYINAAKVGLCPFLRNIHHDTTYANKMFQYMAFQKPVIVSDCSAQSNVVINEQVGMVFEAGNSMDLSSKILDIQDFTKYKKYSENAFQCVKTKFNWKESGKMLLSLYDNLPQFMQ
jgi:glycosyltransferase involved in cell wall biosynthesis